MSYRLLRVLVLALVTAVFATAVPMQADATPRAPRPRQVGHWVVDGHGHVLVMHGVNMVYKLPPYAPDKSGFGANDARFLARNGFTAVRLGLIWNAVEPKPGKYDDRYLARVRRTVRVLANHGIRTLLDFHQDLFSERFQGEGAPDWAVQDDGLPAQPQAGFPYNYFAMPALWRAFDNFWANAPGPDGVGLQVHYARAWQHVASYFSGTRGVFGFDLFNEPWPGTDWESCASPTGCPVADSRLTDFSQRVIDRIRRSDKRTIAYYEPQVLFNSGAPTYVAPHGRQVGFSFHDYCVGSDSAAVDAGCGNLDKMVFDNAESHADDLGQSPLLTEFGATTDRTVLRRGVDLSMAHQTGWMYWAYCGCDDPTTTGPGSEQALVFDPSKPPKGKNVDRAKLRVLAVPHPLSVAGTPLRYNFVRESRVFTFRYTTAKAGSLRGRFHSGSLTTISVPRVAYHHGYRVSVRGARVLSAPDAHTLRLALRPGHHVVSVRLSRRPE
jgi:endoglycosylceramidase